MIKENKMTKKNIKNIICTYKKIKFKDFFNRKPKHIQAIDLVKELIECMNGNFGLLRFSVEKLKPKNEDANKWEIILSFYKTLSSQQPTKYLTEVILDKKIVRFNEIDESGK